MGERYTIRTFVDCPADDLARAFDEAARRLHGEILWDRPPDERHRAALCWAAVDRRVATYLSSEYGLVATGLVFRWVMWKLDAVCLHLRVQEGSLWDYTLFRGEAILDEYSTWPQYWGGGPADWRPYRGSAPTLAAAFGVDVRRIERYLRPWKMRIDKRSDFAICVDESKAYPDDEHPYGEWRQMYDLMRALNIPDPCIDAPPRGVSLEPVDDWETAWKAMCERP